MYWHNNIIFVIYSLESSNRHEIREAYDVTSLDGSFPDQEAPQFRNSVVRLVPALCQLTFRLLRCMAHALGIDGNLIIIIINEKVEIEFEEKCHCSGILIE